MTSRTYTLPGVNQPALKEELETALGQSLAVLRIVSGDYHDLEGQPLGNLRITYSAEPDEADDLLIAQALAAHDPARRTAEQGRQDTRRARMDALAAEIAGLSDDETLYSDGQVRTILRYLLLKVSQ